MQIAMKDMFVDGFPTKDSTPSNDHRVHTVRVDFLSSRNPTLLHIFQDFGLKKIPEKKTSEADTFNILKVRWVTL